MFECENGSIGNLEHFCKFRYSYALHMEPIQGAQQSEVHTQGIEVGRKACATMTNIYKLHFSRFFLLLILWNQNKGLLKNDWFLLREIL